MLGLSRLPIAVAPARHETVASYLARLAALHGLHPRELWEPISSPRPGTGRLEVIPERLAAITGRPSGQLAEALPELRDPPPDWMAWRHQSQPRCPRCDARHDGGPVARVLPHHRYVCTPHRHWIGPPDAGQPAAPLDGPELHDVVRAQRRHLHLLRRHGPAVTFDAVLTGLLLCAHLWDDWREDWQAISRRWTRRGQYLIPVGYESMHFSASRLFAAVYPEAVELAHVLATPTWRSLASGDAEQQRRFVVEVGRRLARPDYEPRHGEDDCALDEVRQLASTEPSTNDVHADTRARVEHSSEGQDAEYRTAATRRRLVRCEPPRRKRHPAPPPYPASARPRMVTTDGRHRRHHLGQPSDKPPA